MASSIRFSELVKKSGQPQSATLWTDPARDAEFNKAIKENRVLTVKQETVGSKKDFGTIGFRREKNVSYLVFPKALPKVDARIIGIKYNLLHEPRTKDRVSTTSSRKKKKSPTARAREREFTATVRRTAAWETTLRVTARNKTDAKKKIEMASASQSHPESEALVRHEIRGLKQVY